MVMVPPAIRTVPAVIFTVLLAAMSVHAFELSSLLTLNILFILHPLYYWSIYRPTILPFWAAFVLGFLIDLVSGNLLGLNAFVLVLSMIMISNQRRYLLSQPFATQWAGFLCVSVAVECIRWLVMMLVNWAYLSPVSGFVSAVFSAVLYPVTALIMLGCLRLIAHHTTERTL
jgi:rod shape-determining protein MreD